MAENNVIRVAKGRENPYSMVANRPVLDKRLSFKARGILWLCLSRPDNWQFNAEYLEQLSELDGRDAVRSGIAELEQAHYIYRTRVRDPQTRAWVGSMWLVFEIPYEELYPEHDLSEIEQMLDKEAQRRFFEPQTENPSVAAPEPQTGFPQVANPALANPQLGNPTLLNTDSIPNTDLLKTEERGAPSAQPPDFLPDQFTLSVKDIKARHFTREQWPAILEAEKARGDDTRKSLVAFVENKLSVNQHPAIQAYREETHYYPPTEWGPRIVEAVGANGRLGLWREVVAAYVGSGWSPRNVKAMLEYFQRGEIPGTAQVAASNTPPRAAPPRTQADEALSTNLAERLQRKLTEKPKWMQ